MSQIENINVIEMKRRNERISTFTLTVTDEELLCPVRILRKCDGQNGQ